MNDRNNLFSKKELYLMECQRREFHQMQKKKRYNTVRMQTFNNMHLAKDMKFTSMHGFPVLHAYTGNTDFEVFPYAKRKGLNGRNQALQFFTYDCNFDNAVWKNLETTTYNIREFDYLFTPDYSLYVDENLTHQNIEFTYRTRFVGAYWQNCGFNVIPTVSWGNANSFSYAFEGLPSHSVLATCGIGHNHCSSSRQLWEYAIRLIETELSPIAILICGEEVEVPGIHTPLRFIPDYITKHFRNEGNS